MLPFFVYCSVLKNAKPISQGFRADMESAPTGKDNLRAKSHAVGEHSICSRIIIRQDRIDLPANEADFRRCIYTPHGNPPHYV